MQKFSVSEDLKLQVEIALALFTILISCGWLSLFVEYALFHLTRTEMNSYRILSDISILLCSLLEEA